jgi:ornithine lipid hydroxylase
VDDAPTILTSEKKSVAIDVRVVHIFVGRRLMDARWVFSRVAYPGLLAGSMALVAWLDSTGVSHDRVVFMVPLLVGCITVVLQRWMPYELAWRGTARDWSVDLLHFVVSTAMVTAILRMLLYDGAAWLALSQESAVGFGFWPTQSSMWVQVPLAVLVGDFFSYWAHRACHEVPWAWRIHAVHHSADRMYLLMSVRNHPLNVALTYGAQTVPLVAVGVDARVLMYYTIVTAVIGILQHSNVELHTGVLSRVLSTPELHRWHHATDEAALNCNFAPDTAIWDQVFGTRYHPPGRQARDVGIVGTDVPVNFLRHLALPLFLERWVRKLRA